MPEAAPAQAEPGPPANYLDLYGLSKPPFGMNPDKGNYILFGSHRRAFELLLEHVVNGKGIIVLQGQEGIGKTAMLRAVATAASDSGVRTIVLSRPSDGRINLAQMLSAFDTQPATGEEMIAQFLAPPRKVLAADDMDLMPADCTRLLLTLAQRIPDDPTGHVIVLTSSTGLAVNPLRPELSQLVSLARNTVRMMPLAPAETRQYIERSLWTAGGTTRRLIAADAMRLLAARSAGVPAIANRLMEAVLTAGFARGDPMITTKTVAAVSGPSAPRPHYREARPPGKASRLIQIAAISLFLIGATAFLYRGITEQPAAMKPAASAPASEN